MPKGSKNYLKIDPLATRGGPGGARDRLRLLSGCVLEASDFGRIFDRQKVGPKSTKISILPAKGGPPPIFGSAWRNARGRRGGKEGTKPLRIRRIGPEKPEAAEIGEFGGTK